MKVKNHKDFARFEYESVKCDNPFKLGEVVFKEFYFDGTPCNEVGVVIQIHDKHELRTDMFGNECTDNIRIATKKEIEKYRPAVLLSLEKPMYVTKKRVTDYIIIKLDLFGNRESLIKEVDEAIEILDEVEDKNDLRFFKAVKKQLENLVG